MKSGDLLDKSSVPQGEAYEEFEELPEAPSAIPSVRRKYYEQNFPPPQAHNCYVGCPCVFDAGPLGAAAVDGRIAHQAKLARRAARLRGGSHAT